MANTISPWKIFLVAASFGFSSVSLASTQQDELVMAGDNVNNSFIQGSLTETKRPWDLAITGSGFFPLQDSKTGELLYTRLGHFELDLDGYVILAGHPTLRLMMERDSKIKPLNLPKWMRLNGALMAGTMFDSDTETGAVIGVYTNGETVKLARFVLAKFFNNGKLTAVEPHIYKADVGALPSLLAPPFEKGLGRVAARSLEQL